MTARTPIYYDSGNLVEMTTAEINEWVTQAIYQYANNPSVTLSVVSSGGTMSPTMADTRFRSSAATQQTTGYATTGALNTVTTNYDKITQTDASVSVTGDTNNILFPVYYDNASGTIAAMSETDFLDTFIIPAIDRLTAATEANAGDYGGTFTISTGTSLANHTLVSSTAVFADTRATTGSFTAGQIGTAGSYQDHPTTVNSYYLHKRNAVDNSPSRNLLYIDNTAKNLNEYAEATIEGYLAEYIRALAINDTVAAGYNIDYNINGSGNARGTAMTDTKLNGSGSVSNRFVNSNDYRQQRFPNGSATTISTFTFNILKS